MQNIKLSKNFWLSELVKSSTADRLGIDNWPTDPVIIERLRLVAEKILQPCRDHFGQAFSPNSGYRCPALNRAVGSKPTSQHMKGEAVDFEISGVPNYELAKFIEENLSFDQLILEFYVPGNPSSGWVHCSFVDEDSNRKQSLTINRSGVELGLVK